MNRSAGMGTFQIAEVQEYLPVDYSSSSCPQCKLGQRISFTSTSAAKTADRQDAASNGRTSGRHLTEPPSLSASGWFLAGSLLSVFQCLFVSFPVCLLLSLCLSDSLPQLLSYPQSPVHFF